MATRCTIKIEGVEYAKIYKHWDGYPEANYIWLKEFNDRFNKERGDDPSYKFAQLLRFASKYGEEFRLDQSEFTGWGVIKYDAECWEEYEYWLTEKEVLVYRVSFDEKDNQYLERIQEDEIQSMIKNLNESMAKGVL